MHWRKSPVLTFGKHRIRGGAPGGISNKKIAVPPNIITLGMQAQGQIEIKNLLVAAGHIGKGTKLGLDPPLGIKMILLDTFIVVSCFDPSIFETCGPCTPACAL